MLNRKGMTLIEVVIATAIISIGAAVLYSGFTTVAKMMIDSKVYTQNVNDQLSALNGKENNGSQLTQNDTTIMIKANGKEIEIEGTLVTASSEVDTVGTLNLKKIGYGEVEEKSNIDSVIKDWTELLIQQAMLATQNDRINYYNQLLAQKGVEPVTNNYYGSYSNDLLNIVYFLRYQDNGFYPTLEKEVIDRCNTIFDNDHKPPIATSHEANMRLGDKQYYIHAYIANPDELCAKIRAKNGEITSQEIAEYVIYYAATSSTNANTYQWRTSLVYNQAEKAWYYKRFPSGNMDKDSYIAVSNYLKTDASELYLEFLNPTKWAKIK
ncbi:prepilin-type N-terminal cleavage/methylation domain-containing protein [Beduini massiliensis]|uniref:prepilin-type N-terminal cleavage/methylation domain-containing protein n=1 Tax=Beduini massiliensis TaxID=1585974 RepID=UPI00059A7A33|nr:prepilin-type N-terminal cleavage/methylation domain-containing protein [Beduini massiliensis]